MKNIIFKAALSWGLLFVLLIIVHPSQLPLVLLFVPFGILYVAIYFTLTAALLGVTAPYNNGKSHIKMIAVIGALLGVVALSLQSIGQLSSKDVVVAGLVLAIGYFYLKRSKRSS